MMKLIPRKNNISLFLVSTILLSIILSISVVNAGLNIKLENDGFDNNITIKRTGDGFVPYIGATGNVNLGIYDLTADWIFAKINWSYIQNIPAGFQSKTGGGPYLYNTTSTIYFNDTFGNNTYIPYIGATKNVNIGRYDFSANATFFTGNVSVSLPSGDAEFRLDSEANKDSCFILQESDIHGFSFCYDGSGTNRWTVKNLDGDILFEIERDTGEIILYNHTTIEGNLTVDDYIIGDGFYITNLNLTSVNNSFIPYIGATKNVDLGVYNITAYMGNFTDLYVSNATLYIGNVSISTNDSGSKTLTIEAGVELVATKFIGDGSQLTNISFFNGSAIFNGSISAYNITGYNITGDYFCNASNCYTISELVNNYIQRYTSGNFTGSLYTTGTNSSASDSNSLFQVTSDTRGTPQFLVQDGGPGQASLMVRSWIVVNQNNTLLNSEQNNLCSDWGFEEIDCNTSTTGADFGVTDDLEVLNLIHAGKGIHSHTNPGGIYLYAGNGDKYEGSNGSYNYVTNIFCDETDSPFLNTGGWIQMIAEGTEREGMAADINLYINSSCIELKNNPGWNESFGPGIDYEVINDPNLVVLDGGFLEYYVGNSPRSQFKIKIENGTGFIGVGIDDTAGADQHQGLTLLQDIKNFAGIVGFNIFSKSSTQTINKDYHLQLLELDTSNINDSGLTFIGAIQVGESKNNEIDFLHLEGNFTNIIKVGETNIISKAYYDNITDTNDVTKAFISASNNTVLFEEDNSIVYIGSIDNFTTIGFSLSTVSSSNIIPLFFYCNVSGVWKTLPGATSTGNGFKTGGTIHFISPSDRGVCNKEIGGTLFANSTNYTYIAIQRTKNNIGTPPVENFITVSGGGNFMILANDYMKLNPVDTAPEICSAESLGGIYFDISEDDMCVCKTTGWRVMTDGTDCV